MHKLNLKMGKATLANNADTFKPGDGFHGY